MAQELSSDLQPNELCERGWHGVADLSVRHSPVA
jgi:hypothetical protein